MKKLVIISLLLCSACFQPDKTLSPIASIKLLLQPDIENNQVVHADLNPKRITNHEAVSTWHLKFAMETDNWDIFLNSLEDVAIFKTATTEYSEIDSSYNLAGLDWQVDIPSSSKLIPGIGTWGDFDFDMPQSYKSVYILRARDGIVAKFMKLQIQDAAPSGFRIRYGALNGSFDNTVLIPKSDVTNFKYLSLADSAEFINFEPDSDKWTLSYTFVADSIDTASPIPFSKTINENFGIFPALRINSNNTQVVLDNVIGFENIDYFLVKDWTFEAMEQRKNLFIKWNDVTSLAEIDEDMTMVLKQGQDFYALRALAIAGSYPERFALELEVKKL